MLIVVTLTKEEWCWKEKSGVEFDVLDKDVTSPQFTQTGYLLSCSLSHDITLVSTLPYIVVRAHNFGWLLIILIISHCRRCFYLDL